MFALNMSDYNKKIWQEEQAARDAALEQQRQKWAKAKARSARNAQRKIDRLSKKLSEAGKLTDWEEEFTESVTERLDKFGSAFQDPEKGRPADALSFAQKKVVAALKKKAKTEKDSNDAVSRHGKPKSRNGFKAKGGFGKKAYQPRVRQLDSDISAEDNERKDEPFIPEYKKPFLRIVD